MTDAEPVASAGLIEAAEWHEDLARSKLEQAKQAPEAKKRHFLDISFFHDECASALRARAADRGRLAALAQSDAEPVRPAWVEPDEDNEGEYIVCVETPAQVEMFEVGAIHFAGALAKAINEHVKLYTAPPRPDASAGLIEAANAIEGLLSEWDKFSRYGSPMAKLANEQVTFARKVLSKLRACTENLEVRYASRDRDQRCR